jgi:hypothetical protein
LIQVTSGRQCVGGILGIDVACTHLDYATRLCGSEETRNILKIKEIKKIVDQLDCGKQWCLHKAVHQSSCVVEMTDLDAGTHSLGEELAL